jgi:hypothetical protein
MLALPYHLRFLLILFTLLFEPSFSMNHLHGPLIVNAPCFGISALDISFITLRKQNYTDSPFTRETVKLALPYTLNIVNIPTY